MRQALLIGSARIAALAAYFSVRFLDRYFGNNSMRPFAYYCLIAGAVSLALVAWPPCAQQRQASVAGFVLAPQTTTTRSPAAGR